MAKRMKSKNLVELVFKKCPLDILRNIYDSNPTYTAKIARDTGLSYCHLHMSIIPMLKEKGIVTTHKTGRIRVVSLTETGKELIGRINDLITKITEIEDGNKLEDSSG